MEEEKIFKTVQPVPYDHIPVNENIIGSETLYRVKCDDNGSIKLKTRIAFHGNEEDVRHILSKDCTTCPPTGLCILESVESLNGWTLYKADVKAVCLHAGEAQRVVYVRPLKKVK